MDMDIMGGGDAVLTITLKGKTVLSRSLERLTLESQLSGGEVLSFVYQPTEWFGDDDQEDEHRPPRPPVRGRLLVEVEAGSRWVL